MTLQSVPHDFAVAASGVYSTFQQTSSALGVSLIGGVFYSLAGSAYDVPSLSAAFCTASALNAACIIVATVLVFLLPSLIARASSELVIE